MQNIAAISAVCYFSRAGHLIGLNLLIMTAEGI